MSDDAQFLEDYNPHKYPPFAVTADICLLTVRDGRLCILLVQRANPPFQGAWAVPGGFVNIDEDVEAAAWRELEEETGVSRETSGVHLEQLGTYGAADRDPRMRVVSVAHIAFAPDLPTPQAGSDAAAARWWAVDDLTGPDAPELGFDHETIVFDAIDRAQAKLEYTTLAASFCQPTFTISELQRVYEAVWGTTLSRAAFHKRVLASDGFVIEEGSTAPTGGRPAKLYRAGGATYLASPIIRPGR